MLPPFGTPEHPNQRRWLAARTAGEARPSPGVFDAELGWSWRPLGVGMDGMEHVNAMGARGQREYPSMPPPGGLRILTFGDSFTFGDEIPDDATYQSILEGRRSDWEVMNFGVSGYGTDQALLRFRRETPGRGARVVVLGLLFENIGRNVNRYRPLWNPASGFSATKPRFILDSGELRLVPQPYASIEELASGVADGSVIERVREHEYWIDCPPVPTGGASSFVRALCAVLAQHERNVPRLWADTQGEPFQVTLALLETFQREALEGGAEAAVVLLFPAFEDIEDELAGKAYWGTLTSELERRGIEYLDPAPALARRCRELGTEDPRDVLYIGYHLSRSGNAIVATELERWIEERL